MDDLHLVAAEAAIDDAPIMLRIESDAEHYRFSYAFDGSPFKLLGTGDERLIASEVANVWSGAYLAMFSEGQDAKDIAPADFDWFDYKTLEDSKEK